MTAPLSSVLDTRIPILSAPMAGAAGPDLVAAVCNAGGYGVLPLWHKPMDGFVADLAQAQAATQQNFAVNINVANPYKDQLQACIDHKVHAVSLFWGMDTDAIDMAKDGGLKVLYSVGTSQEAKAAEAAGADVIVAQGWEAGGHVWGRVSSLALIPAVVDAVNIPVVAAGGIADGRAMAAAMMLGASGVWVGTRFLASTEATIHETYRQRILDAREDQTEWYHELYDISWPDAPHRALKNSTSQGWHQAGAPKPGQRPNEGQVIGHRPNGDPVERYQSYTPFSGTTGDVDAMSLWSGQGVSQVRQVMSAAEIVDELYRDAQTALQNGRSIL
ncbi:NAD(P)H-dependent flavin oxidoreductase [Falsiruegeria mediterranea]|uniref:Nitronate monooxygenase n=1 Tax=Falsiruegeria mediterranea M17 TaxID=1200281 RepID=A0A2R8CBM8_9RHOB|nr:nitronate monooxygenase [Falsiruegeria mediterranea]SPJ29822.1 Nitronate monooxygenase [Falsiruegeria mediterranea M17]